MTIKQLKQIVILTAALFPILVIAQNQTSSPYSFLGLGDLNQQGNVRTFGMGGTNMAVRSNMYINFNNPASYTGIDSLSFVAGVGVQSTVATYRTNEQSSRLSNTSVSHLSFAFPITHWWKSSIGLLPYSSVGYEVLENKLLDFNVMSQNTYSGSGGLDKVTWGNAFQITKELSIGINSSYYFGRVENRQTVLFPDSIYIVNARLTERDLISGLHFAVGAQYFLPTGKNSFLGFAAKFSPLALLNVKTDFLSTTFRGAIGSESAVDTISSWRGVDNSIDLPYAYGFGVSWEKKNKLLVAADLMFDNWSSFNYGGQQDYLTNKMKASFGMEFIPENCPPSSSFNIKLNRASY